MPLKSGSSQKTVSRNIRTLYKDNESRSKPRPRKQIIAIALRKAGKARTMY